MTIQSVGVIGAGTMGNGIAHVFARSGFSVVLCDVEQRFLDRGLETIGKKTDIVAVNPQRLRKRLLADAGNIIDEHQQGVFELNQASVSQHVGDHRKTNLLKSAHQRSDNAPDRDAVRPQDKHPSPLSFCI